MSMKTFLLIIVIFKSKLTCLSNQELTLVKKKFPEISTILGDGRNMNIRDDTLLILFTVMQL